MEKSKSIDKTPGLEKVLTNKTLSLVLINLAEVIADKLHDEPSFTGKIVYTINCRSGGIGNTEAFVQKQIY